MRALSFAALVLLLSIAAFAQDKPKNSDIENIGNRDITRHALILMSADQEAAMGRQSAAEYESRVKLSSDPAVTGYVNQVGQTVLANSDAKNISITFKVVDCPEVDAKAFPGFVYVTTGTVLALDNEPELAFSLARSVAHIAAHHAAKAVSKAELINWARLPLIYTGVGGDLGCQAAPNAAPQGFLQVSRKDEAEADYLGLQYIYKAGYDPNAAVTYLEKIRAIEAASGQGNVSSLLRPVPPAADRIAAVQKNISIILPARAPSRPTTPEFDTIKSILKQ